WLNKNIQKQYKSFLALKALKLKMPLRIVNRFIKYRELPPLTPMCNYLRRDKPENKWDIPVADAFHLHKKGKKFTKKLREFGLVPSDISNFSEEKRFGRIAIPHKQIKSLLETFGFSASLLKLKIKNLNSDESDNLDNLEIKVIAKEVFYHPISQEPLSVTFQRFIEDKPIKIQFPIFYENKLSCKGVRKQNGALRILKNKILCVYKGKEKNLPKFLRINLANLELGRSCNVFDINFPPEVKPVWKYKTPPKFCKVVACTEQKEEEKKEEKEEKN
ncbi:hypothetical protein MHBO_002485, partial [Bonamia ostreae]